MTDRATFWAETEAALDTGWAGATPILWPNLNDQSPPADGSAFMRVTTQHNFGFQSSLASPDGKRTYRAQGILFLQIFTPLEENRLESDTLAETAINIFRGLTTASGVRFRNVTGNEVGVDAAGGYWQINVSAEFEYDETR